MNAEAIIAALAEDAAFAMPDLVALGRAVFDAIERKNTAAAAAADVNVELAAVEAAADVAEAKKVGP